MYNYIFFTVDGPISSSAYNRHFTVHCKKSIVSCPLSHFLFLTVFPVLITKSFSQATGTVTRHGKFGTIITETPALQHSPVVVILGWNGSKEKHLKKYSEIFEAKNFDSICVPAKPFDTFLRAGTKVKQISLHVLNVLVELNCQRRPVFLYAFSNGGCAMFFHMMEALAYPTQPFYQAVPIVGTIFDSCPISPDINSLKATKESVVDMIKNPILKRVVWYSLGVVIPPVIHFNSTVKRYMSGLIESPLQCPQLLLYSKADKFAPYQDIESYAQARRDRGTYVVTTCWESSEHVNHYREHTDDYLDVLNSFVDQCIATYKSIK